MVEGNITLGRFQLVGIPPAPRGVPQIEVTFDIDVNGIVNVSAKDLGTGNEQKITIKSESGLTKKDFERMVQEASQYEEEDAKRLEEAETRNKADSLVYQSEKLIKDLGAQIDADLRSRAEKQIKAVKNSLTSGNISEIKKESEDLEKLTHELAQKLYAQQAAQQAQAQAQQTGTSGFQGAPGGNDESEVVDVDYEIVDDE